MRQSFNASNDGNYSNISIFTRETEDNNNNNSKIKLICSLRTVKVSYFRNSRSSGISSRCI